MFNNSELKKTIDKGVLCFPDPENLPKDDSSIRFYMSAVDAFAWKNGPVKHLTLKYMSHSERVFNYRLFNGATDCGNCVWDSWPSLSMSTHTSAVSR
ncbi:hypothetical protein DPMN_173674 [Dreissena polymorpha]|uniref:Uncharacterized protein n=1 Tax=Dreissena polymorpha TaxID=45954 RepID=A0A9D4E5Z1_DREPO|nr:hypothetical protein DPMN_173674 [Dreissena polymorpha]